MIAPTLSNTTSTVQRFPYILVTELHADCAPFALVEHADTGTRHRVAHGASATLMYLLARRHLEDEAADLAPAHVGWVTPQRLMYDIWGLAGDDAQERIAWLVNGIRKELVLAGFSPAILEERPGAYRVRAQRILVDGLDEIEHRPVDPGSVQWDYDEDLPTDPMIILRKRDREK